MLLHVQLVSTFLCAYVAFQTFSHTYSIYNAIILKSSSFVYVFVSFSFLFLLLTRKVNFNSSDTYTHAWCLYCIALHCIVIQDTWTAECDAELYAICICSYRFPFYDVYNSVNALNVHVLCDAVIHGIQNDQDHVLRAAFPIHYNIGPFSVSIQ